MKYTWKVTAKLAQDIRVLPQAKQERLVDLAIAHRDKRLDVHAPVRTAEEKNAVRRFDDVAIIGETHLQESLETLARI